LVFAWLSFPLGMLLLWISELADKHFLPIAPRETR